MSSTRGVRNNNPFNICKSSSRWLGKVSSEDSRFEKFLTLNYGVRAGVILVRNYIRNYKLQDVRSIISRFAPPSENNTESYVKFAESFLEQRGYDPFCIEYPSDAFVALLCAICKYESQLVLEPSFIKAIIQHYHL